MAHTRASLTIARKIAKVQLVARNSARGRLELVDLGLEHLDHDKRDRDTARVRHRAGPDR